MQCVPPGGVEAPDISSLPHCFNEQGQKITSRLEAAPNQNTIWDHASIHPATPVAAGTRTGLSGNPCHDQWKPVGMNQSHTGMRMRWKDCHPLQMVLIH